MSRVILLGIIGVAVIVAALALNYAITRDEADDAPIAASQTPPTGPTEAPPAGPSGVVASGPASGTGVEGGAVVGVASAAEGAATAAGTVPPEFDVVQVSPTGGMVIAGRAAPESEITVLQDGAPLGTVQADRRGEWVLVPDEAIEAGSHEFALAAQRSGEPTVESEDVVVVVVPEARTDVAGRPQEETGRPLAFAVPREGQGGATVFQKPTDGARTDGDPTEPERGEGVADGGLVLDSITYGADGWVTVGGRAEPGARVEIFLGGMRIAVATVDGRGRWEATSEGPVPEGLHRLRVHLIGPDGRVVARVESPFQRTAMADPGSGETVIVQPGNSLWRIARRRYGRGVQYTVIFEANQSQIEDPDLIYPGQVFVIPPVSGQAE